MEQKTNDSLARSLGDIEQDIERGKSTQKLLNGWIRKLGFAAVVFGTLSIVAHAPVFVAGAILSVAGFAATNFVSYLVDRSVNQKYEAQASLTIAREQTRKQAPGQEPSPAAPAREGLSQSFGDAGRINKLEAKVEDLQQQVEGKPVVLDKPKGMFSRFKIGG